MRSPIVAEQRVRPPFLLVVLSQLLTPFLRCSLIYPGFGLGVIASRANRFTDGMINAGVGALAKLAPALEDPDESLLPALHDLRHVSVKVAVAVANAALQEGVAQLDRDEPFVEEEIRRMQWDPGAFSLAVPSMCCLVSQV